MARTRAAAVRAVSFSAARNSTADLHQVRYDRVSFVTVHNAYSREGGPIDARGFDEYFDSLYERGVRGLELDFIGAEGAWSWSVGHTGAYVANPLKQLGTYLRALWSWSIKNEPHDPIELHLESKDPFEPGFSDRFDEYVAANFDVARMFLPRDLIGEGLSHVDQGSQSQRWPTIGALQNRFLFCISGDGDTGKRYAASIAARPDRLCFADRPISFAPGDPMQFQDQDRVIVNVQCSGERWKEILSGLGHAPWILPRTWNVDDVDALRAALAGGAWAIATNSVDRLMAALEHRPFIERVGQITRGTRAKPAVIARGRATPGRKRPSRASGAGRTRATATRKRSRRARPRSGRT